MPPYTVRRWAPDVEAITLDVLRAGGVPRCSTEVPANLYTILPYVVAYRAAGASGQPRLSDRALIHVQAWGASRESAADLAETCRVLLWEAAHAQAAHSGGYVNRLREDLAPAEVRTGDQPDRTWRFDAEYTITVRPVA